MLTTFLPALAWATVLTIATWPLFVAVRRRSGQTQAAAAITALIAVAVLAPLVIAIIEGVQEIREIIRWYVEVRKEGFEAPEWIASLPVIGPSVADWLNAHLQDERGPFSGADVQSVTEWGRIIGRQAARRITTLLFALLIVFFMFRESDTLLRQFDVVGTRLLGEPARRLGRVAAAAVRGTIDGLLLIGIGEAALLGIAYAVSGVPHPVTLGVLTGVLSALPMRSAACRTPSRSACSPGCCPQYRSPRRSSSSGQPRGCSHNPQRSQRSVFWHSARSWCSSRTISFVLS